MFLANTWEDYEVLDTGDGEKLERWGNVILRRPDPQTIWPKADPALWKQAQAHYHRSEKGGGEWEFLTRLPERWTIQHQDLRFYVRPTGFKHTGLFPEQAANWDWFSSLIRRAREAEPERQVRVLNLFAYTGGATVAAAAAGAAVVHVDASKGMTAQAKENARLCGLSEAPIRYIVDDCSKFVEREIRRGNRYDGIIMDPPSYGRGPGGEVWKLEDCVSGLVGQAEKLLSDNALFFLLNTYTTGLSPMTMRYIADLSIKPRHGGHTEAGELCLPVRQTGSPLPCGGSVRWEA